jgi:hypothetical protein
MMADCREAGFTCESSSVGCLRDAAVPRLEGGGAISGPSLMKPLQNTQASIRLAVWRAPWEHGAGDPRQAHSHPAPGRDGDAAGAEQRRAVPSAVVRDRTLREVVEVAQPAARQRRRNSLLRI